MTVSAEQLFADTADVLRRQVTRIVGASDAEDIVQDAFVRIIERQDELEDQRLAGWLHRVAKNAAIDHLRRRRSVPLDHEPIAELPEDDADIEALARCVSQHAASLPEPYAEALRLTELEGLTQRAAAARIGVPLSTLKSRVQRGRARVVKDITTCCEVRVDRRGRPYEAHCDGC